MDELAEIIVEVEVRGKRSVKVTNGVQNAWIPYSLIDDDSEVHEKTPVGTTATLIIPEWKAIEAGLV